MGKDKTWPEFPVTGGANFESDARSALETWRQNAEALDKEMIYRCSALTGGGAGALDAIDGANLVDGDFAIVVSAGVYSVYELIATSGQAESSPDIIAPDVNAGDKRWLLRSSANPFVSLPGNVSNPVNAPNTAFLYAKDIAAGACAPFGMDEGGAECGLLTPAGVVVPWIPGYFGNGSNGSYTNALGAGNTAAQANAYLNPLGWYVCDGAALNLSASPIFNGTSRYLPKLTDDRFLMGDTTAGGTGGANTMAHTHNVTTNNHTHTGPSHTHDDGTLFGNTHNHKVYEYFDYNTTANVYEQNGFANSLTIAILGNGTNHIGSGVMGEGIVGEDLYTNNVAAGVYGNTGAAGTGNTSSNGGETVASGAASNTENRPLYLSCFYIMKVV